jgi:cell division septation protein DedD
MGLLVHTSFETPEGFAVSSVYCRIVAFTYNPGQKSVSVQHECYVDREKRLQGYRRVQFSKASEVYSFTDVPFPTMASLYALLKITFVDLGFTVEDVDPDPEEPPAPAEPATEPPAPTEPATEPPAPTEPTPSEPPTEPPAPAEPTPSEPPTEPPAE